MEEMNKKLDEIDELLKDTSSENRVKFNKKKIKPTVTDIDFSADNTESEPPKNEEMQFDDISSKAIPVEPVKDEPEEESVADATQEEIEPEIPDTTMRIIDETSTTITIEEGPEITMDELSTDTQAAQETKKEKKPKEKIKLNVLQIVIIAVVSVITLWCIVFTVDHLLSAQGLTPLFSFQTEKYEDGSLSYMGAGYKTQFQFDANGNLTQKCVPFWKDGPNDIKYENNADSTSFAK